MSAEKKPLKILVVDDEPSIRQLFLSLLQFYGHEVLLAENGEKAEQYFKDRQKIDLVFLDFKMPGIDGLETFRRIKKINRTVPVVMVTGYAPEDSLQKAKESGLTGFIKKPMDIKEIEQAIISVGKKAGASASVLIVDDDPSVLEYFKNISSMVSFQYEMAPDAQEAIRLLRDKKFDFIFLDVVLLPGDSEQIQKEIFSMPLPHPEIILISGYKEKLEEAQKRMTNTISAYFYKPLQVQEIINAIYPDQCQREGEDHANN